MPSLVWVYEGSLVDTLHRATWLETSAELQKLGWDVTLVASDVPSSELAEGVRVVCLPRPRVYLCGYLLFHFLLLLHAIRCLGRTDVMLCHQDSAPSLLLIAALRRLVGRRRPRIVMDSRSVVMNTGFSTRGRIRNLFYRVVQYLANSLADGQTAITFRMARAVGIPDRQLLGVWPSGVRVEDFTPAATVRRWPQAGEPLRLAYVGAFEYERNLLGLCKAVAIVRSSGEAVTLLLVGQGPQRRELENYAKELGRGAIIVAPAVPRGKVPALLGRAHVGVLPFPDWPEFRVSSPIKLFEYMAAGMPIIATRIPCHTDVLGSREWVFWAEDESPAGLAGAIQRACAAKTRLQDVSLHALSVARDWSWRESARQLSDALLGALVDAETDPGTV